MPETRTGNRFSLHLPIRIHHAKSKKKISGVTQDLSAAAVYIQAGGDFKLGSRISFEITLPADAIGGPRKIEIHGNGRVVRVDAKNKKHKRRGVACVIDRYRFVRG